MKLIIKQRGKKGIRLWFPNRILFSKVAYRAFCRSMVKSHEKMEAREADPQNPDGLKWQEESQEANKTSEEVKARVNRQVRIRIIKTMEASGIRETIREEVREAVDADGIRETIRKEVRKSVRDGVASRKMEWKRELEDTRKRSARQGFDFGSFLADLPDEKIKDVMGVFRRMRKDHPGVPLIDVQSADGDRVLIKL